MRKSPALAALALLAALSGCATEPVVCSLAAPIFDLTVDAGTASGIEACVQSVCASSIDDGQTDYSSELRLGILRESDGSFTVSTDTNPPEVVTITTLNDDGTPAGSPRTFDLDWSPKPGECGWAPASTDPISL